MATDDWHYCVLWVIASDFAEEACGANDVKGSNTEDTTWIKDASLLKGLRNYRHSRVYRVGDDQDVCFWCNPTDRSGKVADNRCVCLREI